MRVDMELIVPGWNQFVSGEKEEVEQPVRTEPSWFQEWDRPEVIPDSYVDEDGLRHAVVFGGDLLPEKLTLQKNKGHWHVKELIF